MSAPTLHSGRSRVRHPIRTGVLTAGMVVILGLGLVFGLRLSQGVRVAESPLVGKPAPDVNLVMLDGTKFRLSDFFGRPIVVNFWASWCIPCRDEAPRLESFAQRSAAEGVAVIGVVWNDSRSAARAFRTEFGLTYPQAIDPGARAANEFGVRGVPETFVIDPNGVIMAKVVGAVGPRTLDDVLRDVLAGQSRTERNDEEYRTRPPG